MSVLTIVRHGLFLVAVGLFLQMHGIGVLARTSILCEEVCTESSACDEMCYENMMEYENGNDISCLDYGVYDDDEICCGDRVCDVDPEADSGMGGFCPADCGPGPVGCGECSPSAQTGCESGEICNAQHCCYVPGTATPPEPVCWDLYCQNDADCCSGNHCYERVGLTAVCVQDSIPG